MAKKKRFSKKPKKSSKQDDTKIFAFLAVFLSIIGAIIALAIRRKDKYVMYYAKQSIVLFIVAVIVSVINSALYLIPILGWGIVGVLHLAVVLLWLVQIVNSLSGSMKETPIIGQYAKKINL